MTPKAREHRFRRLKEMGCIASFIDGMPGVPPEIHHLNLGGKAGQKRRGDEATIPLSRWHHRGIPAQGMTAAQMTELYGPSLAHNSRAFRARYGSDDELLAKVNDLIRMMDELATAHLSEALDVASLEKQCTTR